MPSASPGNIVRANLITFGSMCFLIGMFLAIAFHRSVLHDYTWFILYLLPIPVLIFAAVLNARRILRMVA
jgi:hypothetical protein